MVASRRRRAPRSSQPRADALPPPSRHWQPKRRFQGGGFQVVGLLLVCCFFTIHNIRWKGLFSVDVVARGSFLPILPSVTLPAPIPAVNARDWGGLERPSHHGRIVSIVETDHSIYGEERRSLFKQMDKNPQDVYDPFYDPEVLSIDGCRHPRWARAVHANCGAFHELDMQRLIVWRHLKQADVGTYREVWIYHRQDVHDALQESVVIKTLRLASRYSLEFNQKRIAQILLDANVMEALSPSPHIVDIYGYCGGSILTEALDPDWTKVLYDPSSAKSKDRSFNTTLCHNRLTLEQKLDYAIQFTESLAEIHGYPGGVMMHGDFHSPQWLQVPGSTTIKLNDFNKGHIFLWNGTDYCPVKRCFGSDFRAPEDAICVENGTEKSDTYTLGNDFYLLLTGLWPHHDFVGHNDDLLDQIAGNERRPFIDPTFRNRSRVEDVLIQQMEALWEFHPHKRTSVFNVLRRLYQVRDELGLHSTV